VYAQCDVFEFHRIRTQMIQIVSLLRNERSTPIFSFLIGLGLVVLFFHKPFMTYQELSVPVSKVEGRTIRVGGKCYSYAAKDSLCPHVNKDGRRCN
jgi:hypothetical protein